jgi:hypothetical protein
VREGTRPPVEHYREAERLLAAMESPGVGLEVQTAAVSAALVHALLATVSPRSLRRRHGKQHPGGSPTGSSAADRWMFGQDDPPRG